MYVHTQTHIHLDKSSTATTSTAKATIEQDFRMRALSVAMSLDCNRLTAATLSLRHHQKLHYRIIMTTINIIIIIMSTIIMSCLFRSRSRSVVIIMPYVRAMHQQQSLCHDRTF